VWVNGVQVINNWTDHGPTVDSSVPITLAAGQRADIVMEYYENGYGATARLLWLTPGATADVAIPASRLLPLSTPAVVPGLVGSYYNNLALSGTPAFTRSENVDFDWGEGSPGTGVGVDTFSVRWTGKLTAPVAGTYVLQTEGDDGMRMWVNGTQMVNDWTDRGPTQNNTPGIVLTAGQQVSIVLEYYENGYGATARLRWKTPGSTSFVIVPVGQLSGP
jgi:hypothetical protein